MERFLHVLCMNARQRAQRMGDKMANITNLQLASMIVHNKQLETRVMAAKDLYNNYEPDNEREDADDYRPDVLIVALVAFIASPDNVHADRAVIYACEAAFEMN